MNRSFARWFPKLAGQRRRSRQQRLKRPVKARLGLERLELRSLLAGDVAGTILDDLNNNGIKDGGENGLPGWTVFVDLNRNGAMDAGEPSTVTNKDGDYLMTGIAAGIKNIREVVPAGWAPSIGTADNQDVTVKNGTEVLANFFNFQKHVGGITGVVWQDLNGDGVRETDSATGAFIDPGLADWTVFLDLNNNGLRDISAATGSFSDLGLSGWTIYLDLNTNGTLDAAEPTTTTAADGSYLFTGLTSGACVVREVATAGSMQTYPLTTGGILWPSGTSNAAVGDVTPLSITASHATGQSYRQNVSLKLPGSGALTNLVDVFLLFDDTGSFVNNSPIVRGAFPTII